MASYKSLSLHTLIALFLLFSAQANLSEWSIFGRTINNNRYYNASVNLTSLGHAWNFSTGDTVFSTPAVKDGILYVLNNEPRIYAINISSGTELWSQFVISGNISELSTPAVGSGLVIVGSSNFDIHAYNAENGSKVWTFPSCGNIINAPIIENNVVYAADLDGSFYAINTATGGSIWTTTLSGEIHSSPALDNDLLYVGNDDTNLYALNRTDGSTVWNYSTGGFVRSTPAVSNGIVYVGSDDGSFYALNASTGSLLWTFNTSETMQDSPAIARGIVFIGANTNYTFALNGSTGEQVWNYSMQDPVISSPAVADNVLFIGSSDSFLYGLNVSTGALLWTYPLNNGSINASPIIADDTIYMTSPNGNVHAFQAGYGGAPNITLNATALDNFAAGPQNVSFNCSVVDDNGIENISLYLSSPSNTNFSLNQSNSSTRGFLDNRSWRVELEPGNYTWSCVASDTASLRGEQNATFVVNPIVAPDISITSPLNTTYSYNANISLLYTVEDANLDTCWMEDPFGVQQNLTNCVNTSFVLTNSSWNVTLFANNSLGLNTSITVHFSVSMPLSFNLTVNSPIQYNDSGFLNLSWNTTENLSGNFTLYRNGTEMNFSTFSEGTSFEARLYGNLTANILPNGNYSVLFRFVDSLNNTNETNQFNFTVLDNSTPSLEYTASSVGEDSAILTLFTDEYTTLLIRYGINAFDNTATITDPGAYHLKTLSGLQSGQTYSYKVESTDLQGNNATSSIYTFTTSSPVVVQPPSSGGGGGRKPPRKKEKPKEKPKPTPKATTPKPKPQPAQRQNTPSTQSSSKTNQNRGRNTQGQQGTQSKQTAQPKKQVDSVKIPLSAGFPLAFLLFLLVPPLRLLRRKRRITKLIRLAFQDRNLTPETEEGIYEYLLKAKRRKFSIQRIQSDLFSAGWKVPGVARVLVIWKRVR